MVDGVYGLVDHVVGHVVKEYKIVLEVVAILHLPVEEEIALVEVLNTIHVIIHSGVVLVRLSSTYVANYRYIS